MCTCTIVYLPGDNAGTWFLDLKNDNGSLGQGAAPKGADVEMKMDSKLFCDMFAGKTSPTSAFMMGKLKMKGDMALAMKLEKIMKKMQKSKL